MDKSHDRELPVRPGQPNAVSPSYQEVLNFDTFVPDYLRAESAPFLGDEPVDTSCFTSHEFFEKEVEKLWPRIWQYACREEEVPNVGDYVVYDIARYSLLITRTAEDKIQAFHNVCLHRGRKLCLENGHAQRFRCPFHGFTWGVNGEFRGTPANWDFSSLTKEDYKLPEAKVEVWAGYVFINMDDNAPPLH
ncbi:MAG: Rieske (2Fe-2S) protein, partial [Pseudomonadota bacterium]